jgi:DNA-binding NtrC family response regulator
MFIRILVVVDTVAQERRLHRLLGRSGLALDPLPRRANLWAQLGRGDYDLVVFSRSRIVEPVGAFLGSVRAQPEAPEIIVLTPEENAEERAVMLTSGCLAVLPWAVPENVLRDTLRSFLGRLRENAVRHPRGGRLEDAYGLHDFVSLSPTMQAFMDIPRRAAGSEASVLILGETGVGKERLARALHAASPRAGGPFLAVNCGALPEGLLESELFGHEEGAFTGAIRARKGYFELAHRGVLFLDEIGEMPVHLQVKLLRVLEDRAIRPVGGEKEIFVDVRIMAASNRDLETHMHSGQFRPDLYYRLAVVTLNVPPLRERKEDIPSLAREYLGRFRLETNRRVETIREDAMDALVAYTWPGNVRELINVMEQACILVPGSEIRREDLPGRIAGHRHAPRAPQAPGAQFDPAWLDRPLRDARRLSTLAFERAYLERLLGATRGRIGTAAGKAGINERSLYDLMRRTGLDKERFR